MSNRRLTSPVFFFLYLPQVPILSPYLLLSLSSRFYSRSLAKVHTRTSRPSFVLIDSRTPSAVPSMWSGNVRD
ncbi:hypothetical protein HDV57DRAFT_470058 [Trichoderma longibrachiatum]